MVESSVQPMVVNEAGEALVPIIGTGAITVRVFGHEELLAEPVVGYHAFCGANMLKHDVSRTHFVIFCARCLLRVTVPKTVTTYGDLREHFKLIRNDY